MTEDKLIQAQHNRRHRKDYVEALTNLKAARKVKDSVLFGTTHQSDHKGFSTYICGVLQEETAAFIETCIQKVEAEIVRLDQEFANL